VIGETGRIERNPCLLATAPGKVECSERELPALGSGQVRIKVDVSMVSTGTELHHIQETHTKKSTFPRSTGYISVGRVVGMAPDVKYATMSQRLLVQQSHFSHHNATAESVKPIPDGVESIDAAAAILLGIALRGIRGGQVRLGDSVVVFGLGVIGQYAVHLAKTAGAHPVIAVDPVAKRREVAKQMGADVVIDPLKQDALAEIKKATVNGEGARVSIDASGTPRVIATLPDVTAEFGRVVVLGGVHGLVPFDLYTRFQKSNLTMVGCGSPYPTDYPYDDARNIRALLDMMNAKIIRPRPVVSHFVPWRQGPEMYRLLMEEKDKAVGVAFDWRE
jgi:2-desacetyl-2-hydroxyethyl bacteriochlorophyllide A dehydrogenase